MGLTITSTGNAGVRLENGAGSLYIDSFFREAPGVGGRPILRGDAAKPADLILLTHGHRDHLDPRETLAAAHAAGATVAGPESALRPFRDALPPERLLLLEPEEDMKPPATVSAAVGGISLTAFRTYHARGHNSYLVEMGGVRIFHDADNEFTQFLDPDALGRVDLLLLCPWAGSEAGDFIARLKPGKWLLIHMNDEEIADHREGRFLPGLVSPIPEGVVALAPGETLEI